MPIDKSAEARPETEESLDLPRVRNRQFWQRTGAICLTIAVSVGSAAWYIAERTDKAIEKQGNRVTLTIKEPLDDVKDDGEQARQYAEEAAGKLEGLDPQDLEKFGEVLAYLEEVGLVDIDQETESTPEQSDSDN